MGRHAEHDEKIIALRKQGLTCRETAERLGIPIYIVYNCMRRNGLVGKLRSNKKNKKPARKPAFSLMILGNNEVMKVMPTSKEQFRRLLKLLQREGGEII